MNRALKQGRRIADPDGYYVTISALLRLSDSDPRGGRPDKPLKPTKARGRSGSTEATSAPSRLKRSLGDMSDFSRGKVQVGLGAAAHWVELFNAAYSKKLGMSALSRLTEHRTRSRV